MPKHFFFFFLSFPPLPVCSFPNWKMLLCCLRAELFIGRFLCTQGAAPGSREVTAGGTTRTVGQPETLPWHQLGYRRFRLSSGKSNREFLSAQQPTGTNCSALSLPHLIKNKQTNKKSQILDLHSVERPNEPSKCKLKFFLTSSKQKYCCSPAHPNLYPHSELPGHDPASLRAVSWHSPGLGFLNKTSHQAQLDI